MVLGGNEEDPAQGTHGLALNGASRKVLSMREEAMCAGYGLAELILTHEPFELTSSHRKRTWLRDRHERVPVAVPALLGRVDRNQEADRGVHSKLLPANADSGKSSISTSSAS